MNTPLLEQVKVCLALATGASCTLFETNAPCVQSGQTLLEELVLKLAELEQMTR